MSERELVLDRTLRKVTFEEGPRKRIPRRALEATSEKISQQEAMSWKPKEEGTVNTGKCRWEVTKEKV